MIVYEINAWTWLRELSEAAGQKVTFDTVPAEEWDRLAAWGFDALWLMGVWERSPMGALIAREEQGLEPVYRAALGDYQPDDVVGSPYCIHRYEVDAKLGGRAGLAKARAEMAERGLRLILDYVPNHVAPDHPWTKEHPEYLIEGTDDDLIRDPQSFFASYGRVYACGRDPYFPAWIDTAQVNAFSPGLRRAAVETLWDIAGQADGVRCDMAMLMVNRVFEKTWGARAGAAPAMDYWRELIPAVRSRHPEFVFVAEAYWDMEWELQQQGFDYCYDKRLYDRLEHAGAAEVRGHLQADVEYQRRLVRFIENHDEPRAAATFGGAKARAAAVVVTTNLGAVLLHDGQFEGRKVKQPVQLRRRAQEPRDDGLVEFYRKLMGAIRASTVGRGTWALCDATGWADNQTCQNLVAWGWENGEERTLVVANYSDRQSQARVRVPWRMKAGKLRLMDAIHGQEFERDAGEIGREGLYVDLAPWAFHFLGVSR